MDYLALAHILIPIVLLIIVKRKSDIKIYRVLILSILPVIVFSLIVSLYFLFEDFEILAAFAFFILLVIEGYLLFFSFLIVAALLVKYLQKIGVDIISATFFASVVAIVGISFVYNDFFDFATVIVIFISAFISVFIEKKLFKEL